MPNEVYRMQLIAMKTIELSDLLIKSRIEIVRKKDARKLVKHSNKDEYKRLGAEIRRANKMVEMQKTELLSRQMRLFD